MASVDQTAKQTLSQTYVVLPSLSDMDYVVPSADQLMFALCVVVKHHFHGVPIRLCCDHPDGLLAKALRLVTGTEKVIVPQPATILQILESTVADHTDWSATIVHENSNCVLVLAPRDSH